MKRQAYMIPLGAIFSGVFFSPWFDEVFKWAAAAMVVVLTLAFNVAFRIPRLWNAIIDRAATETLTKVLMDPDLRKVTLKMHEEQMKALKKGNPNVRKA